MSTKAEIWFNKFQIPVNPEEIKVTYKGVATSIKVEGYGEVFHKGKRDACTVSFSSFFPKSAKVGGKIIPQSYYAYSDEKIEQMADFPSPRTCHDKMIKMLEDEAAVHFVYCNSGGRNDTKNQSINIYAYISSYQASEQGGDPDVIHYTVELKEMRSVPLKVIKNKKMFIENRRPGSKEIKTTHVIKEKDTLYTIAKAYDKKNPKNVLKKIIKDNKSVLGKWNKAYRKASKKGKKDYIRDGKYNLLKKGTLTMPGAKKKKKKG